MRRQASERGHSVSAAVAAPAADAAVAAATAAAAPERANAALRRDAPEQAAAPRHVAVIMDGNGRWAAARGESRTYGHRAGANNIGAVIRAFGTRGVRYVTLYAFSTENWERPDSEVAALLELIGDIIQNETRRLHSEGVRLRHLGRIDRLPPDLQSAIRDCIELTKGNTRMTVCVAFDYGGRAEILDAARAMIADGVKPEDISEDLFHRYLYTDSIPDPDLIIRTSGELRVSNFLIWQAAYAEYYATPVFWPDFDEAEVDKALADYATRKRRFGKTTSA